MFVIEAMETKVANDFLLDYYLFSQKSINKQFSERVFSTLILMVSMRISVFICISISRKVYTPIRLFNGFCVLLMPFLFFYIYGSLFIKGFGIRLPLEFLFVWS